MLDRLAEKLKNIFSSRLVPIVFIYIVLFFVLIIRMFSLQIVVGEDFVDSTVKTEEKNRDIKSTRGKIYDCNGKLLASNEISYSVTIQDTGEITTNEEKNEMIYKMLQIIKKNNEHIDIDFEIEIDKNNQFVFNVDKTSELRFKRDAYFKKSVDELSDEQKNATAAEVFEYLRTDVQPSGPKFDISDEYPVQDALEIMAVRYTLMINSNTKYIPITVASNVKEDTVIAIKEGSSEISGVKIEESSTRLYYDSKYFSNIIGYTGKVSSDSLEELTAQYEGYTYNVSDQIGKTGIELSMEETLRGTKGSETIVIDNYSRIIDTKNITEPVPGEDIYLTIDSDIQKACYTILEKKLAGILISKINNSMDSGTKGDSASDIRIPIYDVYNALIDNNVIDTTHFSSKKASATEKKVYREYESRKKKVLKSLDTHISLGYGKGYEDLNDEYAEYLSYIFEMLTDSEMLKLTDSDKLNDNYINFQQGTISLSKFLEFALVNNMVDLEALGVGEDFFTTSELFEKLKQYIFDKLEDNVSFDKLIYKYMIYNYTLSGTDVCLILIDQQIVKASDETTADLKNGTQSPYSFILAKITNLELTPAMLALDPCSGSVMITDVKTGKVIACVSYPTYDNNKFANEIDTAYYNEVMNNKSFPMMNRPSMQKTAPGSTFKMVTSAAALEENGILSSPGEKIKDKHEFKEVDPSPKCWSTASHGSIDVAGAIRDSCNYFFYEVGYRMGGGKNGVVNHEKGLSILSKYATMFGFDSVSGIELPEAEPKISNSDCVRSAIGQGNNNYTPAQISRYITAVANSGTCYDLTLIDKIGINENIRKNNANIHKKIKISDMTWDYIHTGMRKVITDGSPRKLFEKLDDLAIAGKTGTAQESDYKPNHALFVSYAPYDNPEITVTTVIPNGYTSGNAAELARDIYKFYYNVEDRDKILNSKVKRPENQSTAFSD
ncbi:MAG: hypothetical protein HFH14_09155 [Lachnospiraceae bacterium]|nr:hypothetical protein [Lachnospiraceae bacterium]